MQLEGSQTCHYHLINKEVFLKASKSTLTSNDEPCHLNPNGAKKPQEYLQEEQCN